MLSSENKWVSCPKKRAENNLVKTWGHNKSWVNYIFLLNKYPDTFAMKDIFRLAQYTAITTFFVIFQDSNFLHVNVVFSGLMLTRYKGSNCPARIKKDISLEPNVISTSNQSVNSTNLHCTQENQQVYGFVKWSTIIVQVGLGFSWTLK